MCEVPEWKTLCDSLQVPDEVPSLEDAIQAHQTLIERITQAYTQVTVSPHSCVASGHHSGYCCSRAQWLRGRASDSRLREPGFESCAAVLKP